MHQNTPTTPSSFRSRIAVRKAQIAAAAIATAAIAPNAAHAVIYTIDSPSNANWFVFDPLDGSYATGYGYSYSEENPLLLTACFGARIIVNGSIAGQVSFISNEVAWPGTEWERPVADRLEAGITIDSSANYVPMASDNYTSTPAVYDDTPRFVGFRYTNQGAGQDETYYGWFEFVLSSAEEIILTRFAIGGPGEIIVTGLDASPIPEPSSAAALAGALVLGAIAPRRRRR